jgi:hypothetical protein
VRNYGHRVTISVVIVARSRQFNNTVIIVFSTSSGFGFSQYISSTLSSPLHSRYVDHDKYNNGSNMKFRESMVHPCPQIDRASGKMRQMGLTKPHIILTKPDTETGSFNIIMQNRGRLVSKVWELQYESYAE